LMLGMSAFFALSDALAEWGKPHKSPYPDLDAPATAERLYMTAKHMREQ